MRPPTTKHHLFSLGTPRFLSENWADGRREGIAKCFTIDNVARMCAVQASFRVLTWHCLIPPAVLSLLPGQDMMRTEFMASLSIHHLCRISNHRNARIWRAAGCRAADHRSNVDVRRYFRVPPAFFCQNQNASLGDFTLIGRLTAAFLAHGPWKGACLGIA